MGRSDAQLAKMLRQEVAQIVGEAQRASGLRDLHAAEACYQRLAGMRTVLCWSLGTDSESYNVVIEGIRQVHY